MKPNPRRILSALVLACLVAPVAQAGGDPHSVEPSFQAGPEAAAEARPEPAPALEARAAARAAPEAALEEAPPVALDEEPGAAVGQAPQAVLPEDARPEAASAEPGAEAPDPTEAEPDEATPAALEDDWLFDDDHGEELDWDPLEPVNRVSFGGNELFRKIFFEPLARGYGFVTPAPVRRSVRRFFKNLSTPSVLVNELLQLKLRDAGTTGARFVINTTVGLAGLFDPASAWGLSAQHADFGETLAIYGAGEGPYLVIPLVGPANARDGLGRIVDLALRPDLWLLSFGTVALLLGGDNLTAYEVDRVRLEELRKSSVDFYAALRTAYLMERRARIAEARLEPRFFARRPEPAVQAGDAEGEAEAGDPADAPAMQDAPGAGGSGAEPAGSDAGIAEEQESSLGGRSSAAARLP